MKTTFTANQSKIFLPKLQENRTMNTNFQYVSNSSVSGSLPEIFLRGNLSRNQRSWSTNFQPDPWQQKKKTKIFISMKESKFNFFLVLPV